mgnify:CR=1 FL=1
MADLRSGAHAHAAVEGAVSSIVTALPKTWPAANPGTVIEISLDDTGVRLERVAEGPRLVRAGKRLVARPTASADTRPAVDVPALVEEERSRWP